jgi:hypothetical protein
MRMDAGPQNNGGQGTFSVGGDEQRPSEIAGPIGGLCDFAASGIMPLECLRRQPLFGSLSRGLVCRPLHNHSSAITSTSLSRSDHVSEPLVAGCRLSDWAFLGLFASCVDSLSSLEPSFAGRAFADGVSVFLPSSPADAEWLQRLLRSDCCFLCLSRAALRFTAS